MKPTSANAQHPEEVSGGIYRNHHGEQKLKQKNAQLEQSLEKATQESTLKQLADAKLRRDYADAVAVLDRIPKEVLDVYARGSGRKERPIEQNL